MEEFSIEICNVCNKLMDHPRILPCAHSFCLKCLESSPVSPQCPTCQIEFQIPEGGLKDLMINEFIDRLTNIKLISINCDSCNENQATKFCVDCSYNFCSNCLEFHGKLPAFRNHRLVPPTKDTPKSRKYSTCKEHKEESMNLFCEKCKVVLCGLCLSLNHKTHKMKHVSEHFESVNHNIEENMKATRDILEIVVASYKSSMGTRHDNELRALNLKKEIKQRGEDLKRVVDSIVVDLNKDVDKELERLQKEADDTMKELKDMKINLNAQIETFNQQLNNLNYENLAEIPQSTVDKIENIPKYSEHFNISLPSILMKESRTNLEIVFGALRKAQAFAVLFEIQLTSPIESFSLKENDIYFCENSMVVDVYNFRNWNCRQKINFKDELSLVSDILIVNSLFYVTGQSNQSDDSIKVIKIDEMLDNTLLKIYEMQYQGDTLRLSKSNNDNILLVLINKLVQLSENGDVLLTINLSFTIYDALQIYGGHFVVCCEAELCIIDHNGLQIVTYLPSDKCHEINSPFCLAKDCKGNIFVSNWKTQCLYILDSELKIISHCKLDDSVVKMCFHETKNMLSILTKSKLINYEW